MQPPFSESSCFTLYEKVWNSHVVHEGADAPSLLYIDRHFVHEATSPQAFAGLQAAGRRVRRPDLTFAVMDHLVPTRNRDLPIVDRDALGQFTALERNCREAGIRLFDLHSKNQGIVHVIGPELGITQPGQTIVCGDSHTSTHGAFGALAFGIGTSEVEHVLATQCLPQFKSRTMLVEMTGDRPAGITAKDMALALIAKIGVAGGTSHVLEFGGPAITNLSMEGRMTICNMSIEAGARAGLIAPDDTTFAYLEGRPFVPRGKDFQTAAERWRSLRSDPDARYDRAAELDINSLAPQVSWGTNSEMVVDVTASVPDPSSFIDPTRRRAAELALDYMDLRPGTPITSIALDRVFIGSCTNSRIEDLRAAARIVEGKHVARSIKQALVVPGSQGVKRQAEKENLHKVFQAAGFEWRDAGCSMCIAANDDVVLEYERCASTSNRSFEGRQGKGSRTHLVSPVMAAAAALEGHFIDVRTWAGVAVE